MEAEQVESQGVMDIVLWVKDLLHLGANTGRYWMEETRANPQLRPEEGPS